MKLCSTFRLNVFRRAIFARRLTSWLAAEPQLTAIATVTRLADLFPGQFGKKQHSIVQRFLRALRKSAAQRMIAETEPDGNEKVGRLLGAVDGSDYGAGPTRPQPLFQFQPSALIHLPMSYCGPLGNILR
jgi:hypothetical protein